MNWSTRVGEHAARGLAPKQTPLVGLRAVLAAIAVFALAAPLSLGQSPVQFRDVTSDTGITFEHTDGSSGERYLIEVISAGVATFDYDGDGNIDIYFLNGAPLKGAEVDVAPRNALYRNVGNFRFVEVTDQSGLGDTGFGLGVAAGDFDNDGYPDLYLNNYGANVFYHNNGDGTFSDVTEQTRTGNGSKVGAGACFLDMDADGDLDLYAASYIKFSYETHSPSFLLGHRVYSGPLAFPAEPDNLFRNNGDGTFSDVSVESGIAAHAEWGMGTICADFDNDGDTDIFVCNDSTRNFYFENDGTGKFMEMGLLAGVAFDANGDSQGSMGVDCADYNRDGWLDLFQTAYQREPATLYTSLGDGLFEDSTFRTGAGAGTFHRVNWGVAFVDFDNDADHDLFIANGHIHDNVGEFDTSTSYAMPNQLLLNTARGTFRDVSAESGDGMLIKLSSRGAAFDDLDNDGDVDAVVLNSRRQPSVLRNDLDPGNNWIQIRLVGTRSNRDGVGARVKLVSGDVTQIDEVHSGRGYQSHYGNRLHFGLGERNHVDRIEVRWIGGGVETLTDIPAGQVVTITEPTGR